VRFLVVSVVLVLGLACSGIALAQCRAPDAKITGSVGYVDFPNSGAAVAQADFIRGVLLLHSFEYAQAREAFVAAQKKDPRFALAYWGEALSYNHTLWGEQDIAAARAALDRLAPTPEARAALAPTARERGYLQAAERLYGTGSKAGRDAAFSAAMADLASGHPEDLNARAFYALSLIGLTGTRRDEANYMRAAAEAEAIYQIDPSHPGALHYLIHAYDDPVHAPLGLRAARLYGEVAPAASHALHMPSHIFFALGMWDDAIAANIASLETARAQGDGGYHSLVWLSYAFFQQERREKVKPLMASLARDVAATHGKDARLRLALVRAMWLVETGGNADEDATQLVDDTGIAASGYFSIHDYVLGLRAASAGRMPEARAALARVKARAASLRPSEDLTAAWFDNITPQEVEQARLLADALDAAIRFHAGERSQAITQLQAAVKAQSSLVFEYGPPWSAKPFEELLGEFLLAEGRKAEAVEAFRASLRTYPKRRLSLAGQTLAEAP
jgi:tetratricopeptide (TPR) repeat protein